jgi:hypothetical protein
MQESAAASVRDFNMARAKPVRRQIFSDVLPVKLPEVDIPHGRGCQIFLLSLRTRTQAASASVAGMVSLGVGR